MSKGLGKWERYVMEVLLCQYIPKDMPEWEEDLKKYGYIDFPTTVNRLTSLYKQNAYCEDEIADKGEGVREWVYKELDAKGKCIYQSFARAVRSLEKKGFVKTEIVPPDPIMKEYLDVRKHKEISFNPKCLTNGIPWQLKYLSKRLTKIKGDTK